MENERDIRDEEAALVGRDVVEDGRFEAARDRGRALMEAWGDEPADVVDLRVPAEEERPVRRRFLGVVRA